MSAPTDNQIHAVPANQFSPSAGTTLIGEWLENQILIPDNNNNMFISFSRETKTKDSVGGRTACSRNRCRVAISSLLPRTHTHPNVASLLGYLTVLALNMLPVGCRRSIRRGGVSSGGGEQTFLVSPHGGRVRVERAVIVGLPEEALYGEENGGDVVHGRPFVLEDVEADIAVLVDVGVEAGRLEADDGRGEWIAAGEAQGELVGLPCVGRALHPDDGGHPAQEVATFRERRYPLLLACHEAHQFGLQSVCFTVRARGHPPPTPHPTPTPPTTCVVTFLSPNRPSTTKWLLLSSWVPERDVCFAWRGARARIAVWT